MNVVGWGILRAPSSHNPCQDDLLGVIGDEGAKIVDNATEVAVWTSNDVILRHVMLERRQYMRD